MARQAVAAMTTQGRFRCILLVVAKKRRWKPAAAGPCGGLCLLSWDCPALHVARGGLAGDWLGVGVAALPVPWATQFSGWWCGLGAW